jgi:hypothetical protein
MIFYVSVPLFNGIINYNFIYMGVKLGLSL